MIAMAVASAALLLQAGTGTATAQGPWILTCDVGTSAQGQTETRTFRLGPNLFQEWKPADKQFGPNLCLSFECKAAPDRLEGVLSTATLVLTIGLDRQSGQATWRTLGASGLARSSGVCAMKPDTAAAKQTP